MADEYSPPLSPNIVWVFKKPDVPYNPPLSPDIIFTFGADDEVNMVAQQHTADEVGGIAVAAAQTLEGGFLVAEGGEESIGEFGGIKSLLGEL